MGTNLVTIATFSTPVEADLAKNLLAEANIQAFLADDASVGWLWHLGNAVGGVKLQVAEADCDRARALLAAPPSPSTPPLPLPSVQHALWAGWTCTHCRTQVKPGVSTCPACGRSLDEQEAPAEEPAAGVWLEDEVVPDSPGEVLAGRALKAAIFGLLACPPLLHVYSLWLLGKLAFQPEDLSPRALRQVYAALVIDVLVIGLALLLLRMMLEPLPPAAR